MKSCDTYEREEIRPILYFCPSFHSILHRTSSGVNLFVARWNTSKKLCILVTRIKLKK